MRDRKPITIPEHMGEVAEINYGGPAAPDFGPLARDRIPVRTMREGDLRAIIAIDRRIEHRCTLPRHPASRLTAVRRALCHREVRSIAPVGLNRSAALCCHWFDLIVGAGRPEERYMPPACRL